MTETPKLGKDVEEERLGSAVQRFVQTQSFNAFERILAQYIFQAITGDPLQSVIFVCRAALSLDEDRCQKLGIKFQEVVSIYAVAQVLSTYSLSTDTGMSGVVKEYSVVMDSLSWVDDIAPWTKLKTYQFRYYPDEKTSKFIKDLEENGSIQDRFYNCCRTLSEAGYNHMVSDFLIYATPKTQEITRQLSEIISPSTWSETTSLLVGRPAKKTEI